MRWLLLCGVVFWIGVTLLLSELRWFSRRPLADRLRIYAPGGGAPARRPGLLSVASFRDVIGPLSSEIGAGVARLFGVEEDLATRLKRIHSPMDPSAFRFRQLGWGVAGLAIGLVAAVGFGMPGALAGLFILGLPLFGLLLPEQQLASQSSRWQERVFLELPVVSEQLGMLLSAGYSLGGALTRLATRGTGCCGRDLARVTGRIRQGLSEVEALREWSALAKVDALDRLVAVLALNREAGDLGRLISDEAKSIRRDVHRRLIERVEKRGQQVWIPVTVATLLPGALFLAVPFVEAMKLFTSG